MVADERNPPPPPAALIQACLDRECVLYGGAGLGAWAGFPVWPSFVRRLLDWAVKSQRIEPGFAESMRAAIQQGDLDAVADNVVTAVLDREPEALHTYLRGLFLRKKPLSGVHKVLQGIPFSAVLTTSFDDLFERAYPDAPVFTPRQSEPLLDALTKRRFFLLKLYGTLDRPETVTVAPAQYEAVVGGNAGFAQCMETLFFSRTLLFAGASLEGIEACLRGITLPTGIRRTHYALVAVKGRAWESKALFLQRRYGIQVLPFLPSKGFPELLTFLTELRELATPVTSAERGGSSFSLPAGPAVDGPGQLKRMVIENVGAFEHLDLSFHPRWNILLGDNGVGKSTLLKALAVAMIGKDAEPFAGRLLRYSGNPTELPAPGVITLQTERGTYRTTVHSRPNQKIEVLSVPGRCLEAEGWLAVGFPPLRTMSWDRPRAQETLARSRPTPNDLLPLVQGDPDPRLNQLKQWIVNLDYWIKDARSRTGEGGVYEKLLQEFFRVVGEITEGVRIQFVEVRPQTFEIIVRTDDGEIPLESVSQGMISLMGWVGVLLQRFYEVYDDVDGADPRHRYALVLMDEIDAHLHPNWQRTLVPKLEKVFPNTQFIATTHSPLVVAGMPPEQVFRFARGADGKVARLPVEADMLAGRADQILTGDLFGLATTLAPVTEDVMRRYAELLGKSRRNEDEEREFQSLRPVLHARIPPSGETPVERRVQELLRDLLRSQAGDLFPDSQKSLLDTARKLFQALQKEPRGAS